MDIAKIGIIGLGGVAQLVHLPNLSKIKNAKVTSVAEIKKSRLETIADKFNIPNRFKNYKDLLENDEVDAVIIATPTNTHKDVAIDCLNAKKDILVEKPLARTHKEAVQIVEVAKKNKCKVMVGMNLRYRPDAMLLRTLIDAGEIGDPYYVKCNWIRRQSSSTKWFTQRDISGGGVNLDLGIHLLDLSLWLLDYPVVESVTTKNYYHNTKNVEDTTISFVRCKNSAVINLEASWSLPVEKDSFSLAGFGTKGSFSTNPFKLYKKMEENLIDLTPSPSESATTLFKKSYLNELKSFIGAVQGLNPVFSSGEEALQRLKIIEAMYKSAKTNKEVKL